MKGKDMKLLPAIVFLAISLGTAGLAHASTKPLSAEAEAEAQAVLAEALKSGGNKLLRMSDGTLYKVPNSQPYALSGKILQLRRCSLFHHEIRKHNLGELVGAKVFEESPFEEAEASETYSTMDAQYRIQCAELRETMKPPKWVEKTGKAIGATIGFAILVAILL